MIHLLRFLVGIICLSALFDSSRSTMSGAGITIHVTCKNFEHGARTQYACVVNNLSVDGPECAVISSVATHLPGKGQNDVQGVFIENQFARYLPTHIEDIYANMTAFHVKNSQLEFIENFNFYKKLKSLNLDNNLIREVPKRIFSETVDMEWLSMDDNRIEELVDGLFEKMPKLRVVSLSGNLLRRLSGSLFANNVNMERLNFNGNQLTTIGVDLLGGLSKLRAVNFDSNICINEAFFNESELIEKLTKQFTNFCSGQCENTIESDMQMKMLRDQNKQMLQQREAHKAEKEIFCRRQKMLALSSSVDSSE